MTLRLLAAVFLALLALAFLLRGEAPPSVASLPERGGPGATGGDAQGSRTTDPESAEVDWIPPPPARNIFRYAEAPGALRGGAKAADAALTDAAEPKGAPPSPPAVRLVGFVRRPEGLRAAIATASGVVIVAPGDVVLGHAVLGLDEDRGLRLRAPDGSELVLVPPS